MSGCFDLSASMTGSDDSSLDDILRRSSQRWRKQRKSGGIVNYSLTCTAVNRWSYEHHFRKAKSDG